jgi:hypothetical protein
MIQPYKWEAETGVISSSKKLIMQSQRTNWCQRQRSSRVFARFQVRISAWISASWLWISPIPPDEYRDDNSTRWWTLPSKHFPMNLSPNFLTPDDLQPQILTSSRNTPQRKHTRVDSLRLRLHLFCTFSTVPVFNIKTTSLCQWIPLPS